MSEMLSQKKLPRAEMWISTVIWQWPNEPPEKGLIDRAIAAARWTFLPSSLDASALTAAGELLAGHEVAMIIGIEADDLLARRSTPLEDRLGALQRPRCDAVMLQHVEVTELKAGRPFHRLAQLRDAGRVDLLMLEAPDVADAEWMVESTPAHAISLPFDLSDQLAKYRVLPAAREMGTAILSRRAPEPRWRAHPPATAAEDLAFRAGEEDVTAVIEPLPAEVQTLGALLSAARSPMSAAERAQWWTRFQSHVPPPPKPPRGHPPEYGT